MSMKFSFVILCSVLLISGRAVAIGEIERVGSWGLNFFSYGMMLAEIERMKEQVRAEYALKKVNLANELEKERDERIKRNLAAEIAVAESSIVELSRLVRRNEDMNVDLRAAQIALEHFREQNTQENLDLNILVETFLQETAIDSSRATSFDQLVADCVEFVNTRNRRVPTCDVVQFLVDSSKEDVSRDPFSEVAWVEASKAMQRVRRGSGKNIALIKSELGATEKYLESLKIRLAKMKVEK